MEGMVAFVIPGLATPWARAGRKGGFSYTPGKQRAAMGDVKVIASGAMDGRPLLVGPLEVTMNFIYPWPKSISAKKRASFDWRWKDTRPDTSNLQKLIEDALICVVYRDDAQIAISHTTKSYGEPAQIQVEIQPLRYIRTPAYEDAA